MDKNNNETEITIKQIDNVSAVITTSNDDYEYAFKAFVLSDESLKVVEEKNGRHAVGEKK